MNQQAEPGVEEFIRLLGVASRTFSMYSGEHPAYQVVLGRLEAVASSIFQRRDRLSIHVTRDHVLTDGKPLAPALFLTSFGSDLIRRGIEGLTFHRGVSRREIGVLVEILARRADPRDPYELEAELKTKGVTKVVIHLIRPAPLEPATVGEALLRRLLSMEETTSETRDVLAEYLLSAPDKFAKALALGPEDGRTNLEDRARWAAQRLVSLMEELLAGRPDQWVRFRDRLAQVILGMELEVQLKFFQEAQTTQGETAHWVQQIAATLPPEALAGILARGLAQLKDPSQGGTLIKFLVPDKGLRNKLMPEIEKKLRDYGISPEEFLRVINEEPLSLDEKLLLFLKGGKLSPEALSMAPALLGELAEEGRIQDCLKVVKRFLASLNHPEWGVRKAAAETVKGVINTLETIPGASAFITSVRAFVLKKALAEPDRDVFRSLSEVMEEEALRLLTKGEKGPGTQILLELFKAPLRETLEKSYLGARNEYLRKQLLSTQVLEDALESLKSGSEAEFQRGVELLRIMGPEAAKKVIELLGEESQVSARVRLLKALKEIGSEAIEPMRKALLDPRWYLVRNITRVLAELKDPKAIPHLMGLLDHPDVRVRREAVRGLGVMGSPKVEEALAKALDDADESVRMAAVDGLRTIGTGFVMDRLRSIAIKSSGKGGTDVLRVKAIRAIGDLGDDGDVATLEEILTRRRFFGAGEPEDIRLEATSAIARIFERTRGRRALESLHRTARHDPSPTVRREATKALEGVKGFEEV